MACALDDPDGGFADAPSQTGELMTSDDGTGDNSGHGLVETARAVIADILDEIVPNEIRAHKEQRASKTARASSRSQCTFRQRDVRAAIKAVESTGHKVTRVLIARDGSIEVEIELAPGQMAPVHEANPWDEPYKPDLDVP